MFVPEIKVSEFHLSHFCVHSVAPVDKKISSKPNRQKDEKKSQEPEGQTETRPTFDAVCFNIACADLHCKDLGLSDRIRQKLAASAD